MDLCYSTDSSATFSGFAITVTAMNSTVDGEGCHGVPARIALSNTNDTAEIFSPNYETGQYPIYADCKWLLQVGNFRIPLVSPCI